MQAEPAELRDRLRARRLDRVADSERRATTAVPRDRNRSVPTPDLDLAPVDDAGDADARHVPELARPPAALPFRAVPRQRSPGRSDARMQPRRRLPSRRISPRDSSEHVDHRRQLHPPLGDGAGLVQHDGGDAPRRLERLRALDEDAELRPAAGADHQRRRRREAERAGTRDDEDGDRGRERLRGVSGEEQPPRQRREREPDHDRDEDGGDPVDETLDRSLPGLRLGDEPRDLREGGLAPDTRCADDETPVGVDRASCDFRSSCDIDRRRLAGQQRLVDGGVAFDDLAVGRNLLAGADHEQVAALDLLDRHRDLGPVPQHARLLRADVEQRADRGARATACARLEVAPEQDQRRDHAGDLEVHVRVLEEECDRRPAPGGERPERDERVHRRRQVPRVERGGAVEAPAGPEDDRRREREREPLPALELERRQHRERDQRRGQRSGDEQPGADRRGAIGGVRGLVGRSRAIARRLHGARRGRRARRGLRRS